jgi:pimeloyl-ACP methyl ester carboxylesterase
MAGVAETAPSLDRVQDSSFSNSSFPIGRAGRLIFPRRQFRWRAVPRQNSGRQLHPFNNVTNLCAGTALVGHDRGARVATRFAKDHPEAVDRLVVMDNVPTRIVGRELDAAKANGYWFFLFHLVPDLPEALITGPEDIWLRYYFSDWFFDPLTIQGEAFEMYVKAYRAPGAIRGAMEDYRANASDVAQDNADASVKIACPVMSLWGRDFKLVGEMFDMPRVWADQRRRGADLAGCVELSLSKQCRNFAVRATHGEAGLFPTAVSY